MSMQRKVLLFATALLLCGAPAFAQNAADLEAAVQAAQTAYDDAVAVHNDSLVARQAAQFVVNDAKAERDRLQAERDRLQAGTQERRDAQARFKVAVEVLRAARTDRDIAQNVFVDTQYAKFVASEALDEARAAYNTYLASPAGAWEAEIARLEAKVRQLEAHRDALQEGFKTAQAELMTANVDLDALRAELELATAELETTTEELADVQDDYAAMDNVMADIFAGCMPVYDAAAPGGWVVNTDTIRCVPMDVIWTSACYTSSQSRYPNSRLTVIGTDMTDLRVVTSTRNVYFWSDGSHGMPIHSPAEPTNIWHGGVHISMHEPYHMLITGVITGDINFELESDYINGRRISGDTSFNTNTMEFSEVINRHNNEITRAAFERLVNNLQMVLDGRADEIPAVPMCS